MTTARMPGRYTSGGCWSGPRHAGRPCLAPGRDCSGWERDTRRRKRAEQRGLAAEFDAARADRRTFTCRQEAG
jgi:hypothetical protein